MLMWDVQIEKRDNVDGYDLFVSLKEDETAIFRRRCFIPFGSSSAFLRNCIHSLKKTIYETYNKDIEYNNNLESFKKVAESECGNI